METKANTALIGAFTLIVLALGFVFVYWMARGEGGSDAQSLTVTFDGPVTGLGTGSPVFFNGLRVGEVERLRIDPKDPRRVIADLSIGADTPVKPDTRASLGFQGLTGLGYVELAGGSPDAPNLLKGDGSAALDADTAAMQDLMASARSILARADKTLTTLDRLVNENAGAVGQSIRNVETFTGALSANSQEVADLIQSVSRAADSIATLSGRMEGVVTRTEAVIAAVEPGKVRSTVDDVSTFASSLAAQSGKVDQLVTRLGAIADDVSVVSGRLASFSEKAEAQFTAVGEKANRLLDAVDPEAVGRTIGSIERAAAGIDRIAGGVPPEAVQATVQNLSAFSETLKGISARGADIDQFITRLSAIAGDANAFSARLPALGEKVDAIVTDVGDKAGRLFAAVDPAKVNQALTSIDEAAANVSQITSSIPPDAVQTAVRNVAAFSETLAGVAARREEINALVSRLSAIAADANAFSARLPAIGERAETILAAVPPERVDQTLLSINRAAGSLEGAATNVQRITSAIPPDAVQATVRNLSAFSETLGGLAARREEIDAFVTRMSAIASDVNAFSAHLPEIGAKADVLMTQVGETAGRMLAAVEPERLNRAFASVERAAGTIEEAAGDVRQVTAAIPAETVQTAVQNLSAFSETLGGIAVRREEIDAMVTRFSAVSRDVNAFSARLPAIGERVESMVTGIGDTADRLREAVDPEAVGRAVDAVERAAVNVEQVTAAVPADAVRATAENLSQFSAVLAARSPDVDALVTRLSAIAGDVGAFTPRLPAIGEKVDGVLAAVDTQKIGESVDGVHRFTTALGNRSGDVDAIMADARATAAQLKGVTQKADSLLAKLDGMAGDEGGGFIAEARATLASIRQTAETFDEQAQSIGNNVNQFSTRGLRDLQNFINEGQRTVARLDRVISSLERDPSQILFGGEGVPEYKGSRSGGRSGGAQRR